MGDIYLLVFVEVADFGEDVETKAYVTRMMFFCYCVVHLLDNTYQNCFKVQVWRKVTGRRVTKGWRNRRDGKGMWENRSSIMYEMLI